MADVSERLATQLLRIARDPATGRLHYPGSLAAGLRAALFTDLILAGRVGEDRGGPRARGGSDTGDRILDAVHRTVGDHPHVAWWRWFRHVRADRIALVDELVTAGRWTARGGVRAAYDDADAGGALELALATQRVADGAVAPADSRQAVLAVLTLMVGATGGRPHPRAVRSGPRVGGALMTRGVHPLVEAAGGSGEPGAELLAPMLLGASRVAGRPLRRDG
jgi:hypothetical protein